MKYRIKYREYYRPNDQYSLHLPVRSQEIEAEYFKIKNGFVAVWFEDNKTQIPNLYINANDVLTIKPIKEEEK